MSKTTSEEALQADNKCIEVNQATCPSLKPSQDSLNQIGSTEAQLCKIKESLNKLDQTFNDDPSIFTIIANFWGKRPKWLKIIIGILLFGTMVGLGIGLQLTVLIVVGLVSAAVYALSSLLLDNHFSKGKRSREQLAVSMLSLVNVLELSITELNKAQAQLKKEIIYFKEAFDKANQIYNENNQKLTEQVDLLSGQVQKLTETENKLSETQIKFEKLELDYEKLQIAFDKNAADLALKIAELACKIEELAEVKQNLGSRVDELKNLVKVLSGTVNQLIETVTDDKEARANFIERLNKFLNDGQASFASIADRICRAECELSASNNRYKKLLKSHEELLKKYSLQGNKPEIRPSMANSEKLGFNPFRMFQTDKDRRNCMARYGLDPVLTEFPNVMLTECAVNIKI